MSLVGTFSDFSVKSYGPLTNTNLKIWKFPKSHNYRSRPKNPTSWKLAQNNVSFFVLPSTTRYQCVLLWRKNSKKLKDEKINWHRSFSKKLKIQKKSQKPLFLRWLIFDIFLQSVFCICILYLYFCIFVFVFVYFLPYLSFFHFAYASVAGWAWSGYFLTAALLSTTRIVIIIIKWMVWIWVKIRGP